MSKKNDVSTTVSPVRVKFPKELFSFLSDLKANNSREWFNENRARYDEFVLKPAIEFIQAVVKPFKKISPHILVIPKAHGGSLIRIYRDTRFSKEKTPYKTNVGIYFKHEFGGDIHAPGFYLHLDPEGCFFGAGMWLPPNPILNTIREAIDNDPKTWKRVRDAKIFNRSFKLEGDSLKTAPRGYDPSHPMIEDLRRKSFIAMASMEQSQLCDSDVVDRVVELCQQSKGFMKYLCDCLGKPF